MPLPEHRVLEHNRKQDNGEPSAQPMGVELQPAIRADLLDPALWQDGLAKYARATHLAVALADAAGRLIGEYINPRPTWSLLHAKTPRPPAANLGTRSQGGVGCPFSLAPLRPCNCIADALATGGFVVARDRTGLVHFAVPLVLGGHPLGALVAGQVFDQYPEQLPMEQVARQLGQSPARAWQLARLEHPVKRATLEVYADLLATLGQTFLQTRYHTILAAERRGQERRAEANEVRARLLKQVMSAREEEQRRIARDLHDQMEQYITALMLGLQSLHDSSPDPAAQDRLRQLLELTKQLARETHRIARELRPLALDDLGLRSALLNYVEEWSKRSNIAVDFQCIGLDTERLPPHVETTLYRIVQEALANVLKHAEARRVSLILKRLNRHAMAIVEDDGRGFDAEAGLDSPADRSRLGLLGMKERVALVGGTVQIESGPGQGTTLIVRIPLEANGKDGTSS